MSHPRMNTDDPSSFGEQHTIDDRWTASKLAAAGYEYNGDGPCKHCGDRVCFYKRERAGDYKGPKKWLVLNEGVLDPHQCQGRG